MSGDSFQVVAQQHVVTVRVTSSINSFGSERRYPKDILIGEMKSKLELITGASPATMKLQLQDKDGKPVCPIDNDSAMLGSFPVEDGMIIHVVDKNLRLGEFEDTSKVEKFEISKDDYEKRTDSVRAFKQRMKMGQFAEVDPEEQKRKEEERREKEEKQKALVAAMKLGDRCEVRTKGQMARRGEVAYLGETEFQSGLWVGVKYDEPVGKNDGCVKGKRYFDCPPKYGGFVRPEDLEVGDFPEEDLELSDDEM